MSTEFLSTEAGREGAKWWVIDAADVPVGRLATEAANLIRGKYKPTFTPNCDCGDFVVVVNADKVALKGGKVDTKVYYHPTGFIGGLKAIPARKLLAEKPERVVERAVVGMLPEGVLGHRLKGKLKVYAGAEHPHAAQAPQQYKLKSLNN